MIFLYALALVGAFHIVEPNQVAMQEEHDNVIREIAVRNAVQTEADSHLTPAELDAKYPGTPLASNDKSVSTPADQDAVSNLYWEGEK